MNTSNPVSPDDQALWVSLSLISGLGGQGICQLLRAFGSPERIFAAPARQLQSVVSREIANAISAGPDVDITATTLAWLAQDGNHLVTLADAHYPQLLLEIPDPPPIFYAKGNLEHLNRPAIAIVGSRSASPQGEKNARDFAEALSKAGYCIVSGMALGIDGAAHQGALLGPGSTIAVVGTGLDIVYPAKHRQLAHQIAEQGLILSEFPLGTPSRAQNFPRRNRIISGLSKGCLVVEANTHSGSLITARLATEQGRDVFAIPGSIHSPQSKGCHELIKQGAKLVDHIHDIIGELGAPSTSAITATPTSQEESGPAGTLLTAMGYEPVTIESLLEQTGLTSDTLSAMLLMLELESKVASLPGGRFQRIT